MGNNFKKFATAAAVATCLLTSSVHASSVLEVNERPSALAMGTDLLLVRPIGAVVTAVGAVLWVVSIPFTAPTGSQEMAAEVLVAEPARYTFYRCLGCTDDIGYRSPEERRKDFQKGY